MRCYLEDFILLSSTCCKMEVARSVVFNRISYPPLILAFCSSVHRYGPLHIYPCICSVAPCLRVLWMSTHGCFLPLFPLSLLPGCRKPDAGAQEPDATVDDDSYYTGGAYYYVQPADNDQEYLRRIPGRRPMPLSISIPVCASLLKANLFNLCLYSDIVASADSSMIELLYSSPRGPWLVI